MLKWWQDNKFIFERWRANVGIGQFFLTVYIAVVNGFPLWLLIVLIILSVGYTVIYDIKYVYPREVEEGFKNNPPMKEMLDILRRLNETNKSS